MIWPSSDVVKVRRQLQAVQCSTSYGTVDLARHIVRNEGFGVLFKGASAAAMGGLFFGGENCQCSMLFNAIPTNRIEDTLQC